MKLARGIAGLLLVVCGFHAWCFASPIRTLREFRQLTNADAKKAQNVEIAATVTYFRPYEKTLFVQDGDAATYVNATTTLKLVPGDRIRIRGYTQPSFHPIIISSDISLLGHPGVPDPLLVSFHDLLRRELDSHYVKVRGKLRSAITTLSSGRHVTAMELRMEGGYAGVTLDGEDAQRLGEILDADVELTGVASGQFDGKMQKTGILLHCSGFEQVKVLRNAQVSQWDIPLTPMEDVLKAYDVHDNTARVRVRGVITYFHQTTMAVLQDGDRSIRILTPTVDRLKVGHLAEATGIPSVEEGFLTLKWGNLRSLGPAPALKPKLLSWDELASGKHAFDLISIEGNVVTQVRQHSQDMYIVEAQGRLFSAAMRHPYVYQWGVKLPPPPMPKIPPGSKVRVTGVAILDGANPFNGTVAFGILLRSAEDVAVIANPPLLNPSNLRRISLVLMLAIGIFAGWNWFLKRQVRVQTRKLATRIEAEAAQERKRSQILEDINGNRPLQEILTEIAGLVAFTQGNVPCWCELDRGEHFGSEPVEDGSATAVRQEISSRSGGSHGRICAAPATGLPPNGNLAEALQMGAWLATLAIETRGLYSDLVHRSEFDQLTDIHNRFALERRLNAMVRQGRVQNTRFGLIYIDLDRFKEVNDRYGHRVGDVYLQQVAMRMKRQLRPTDMLARIGGDEFAVLIDEVHSRTDVEEVAARIERCFDDVFSTEGVIFEGGASMGIAVFPQDGALADTLLNWADSAMYEAKRSRREWGQRVKASEEMASRM